MPESLRKFLHSLTPGEAQELYTYVDNLNLTGEILEVLVDRYPNLTDEVEETKALQLVVVDEATGFKVLVVCGDGESRESTVVVELNWYGGRGEAPTTHPFTYAGRDYCVFGPYHTFKGSREFVLYELTEVARA